MLPGWILEFVIFSLFSGNLMFRLLWLLFWNLCKVVLKRFIYSEITCMEPNQVEPNLIT